MLWALIGLALGVGWVLLGRHDSAMTSLVRTPMTALSDGADQAVSWTVSMVGFGSDTTLGHILGALAATAAPGLLLLVLVRAIRATRSACSAAAVLVAGIGLVGMCLIPAARALPLVLAAVVLMLLLALGTRAVSRLPMGVLTGAVTVLTFQLVQAPGPYVARATEALASLGGAPGLWAIVVAAVALAPAATAAAALAKD